MIINQTKFFNHSVFGTRSCFISVCHENWFDCSDYQEIEDYECDWTQDALYMVEVENNIGMHTVNDEPIPAMEYDTFLFMHYKGGFKYNAATA